MVLILATVIRLKRSGRMARFAEDGRLLEWTPDPDLASYFSDVGAARAAIRGICAPEIRRALRHGRAALVLDEDTGEELIVDAGHTRVLGTPRIRIDAGPRYIQDDPLDDGRKGVVKRKAMTVRTFVRGEFAEVRQNPKVRSKGFVVPSATAQEYTMSVTARRRVISMMRHVPGA